MQNFSESEYALKIDFEKNSKNPSRVFKAAEELIQTFEAFDKSLVTSIDPRIVPTLILEDLKTGSLLIKLKNLLEATDDQALREMSWKKIVGPYLVKAKYKSIEFLNNRISKPPTSKEEDRKALVNLSNEIKQLADETDVKYLPDYSPIPPQKLIVHLSDLSRAKNQLSLKDQLTYQTKGGDLEIKPGTAWTAEEFADLYVEKVESHPSNRQSLLVKKPDYIGRSKWELKLKSHPILATIADEHWLQRFQNREIDVRPGDALECSLKIEIKYGFQGEILGENYIVETIHNVRENREIQGNLLDDETEPKA